MSTNVFNKLGQSVLPKVFGKLSGVGLTDTMEVRGEVNTVGTGGGQIRSRESVVYKDIPVVWEVLPDAYRVQQGDQIVSTQNYQLKFPTHNENGVRYNIDPRKHRLRVVCRRYPGTEPDKIFRIVAIQDRMGNMYEAECIRENV